jgi:hypothetical protein
MKYRIFQLFSTIIILAALTSTSGAEVTSGPVKLAESSTRSGPVTFKIGKVVKATGQCATTDFFGSKVIDCGVTVKNTGAKPMFCVIHVAFFDKDNHLLGCASQTSFGDAGLKPGEETQFASMLISMPPDELKKVASYQTAFYESEKKI